MTELLVSVATYAVAFAIVWFGTQWAWKWHYRRMDRLWDEAYERVYGKPSHPHKTPERDQA